MIIAVDFDGILCEDKFPEIGEPNYEMIHLVRQLMDQGHEVILWTSRVEDRLQEAVDWCEDRGLHFTVVNEGAPSNLGKYPTNPRKIYANIYIDDHNPEFMHMIRTEGWKEATRHTINNIRGILKWQKEN